MISPARDRLSLPSGRFSRGVMSRYVFDGLSEQQQQQQRRVYHDELPLPTYDEVVGAAAAAGRAPSTSLKTEVLLAPTRSDAPEDRTAQHTEIHYEPRFASSRKSSVLMLIGLILIPLCALIVFIQVKGCSVSNQQSISTSSEFLDGDGIDSLYSKCMDEKNNLLRLIHDYLGSTESRKLLQNYESALKSKEELESSLQNLREQLQLLNIEKDKLEWLLANANKTFTNLTSDKHDSEVESSTPASSPDAANKASGERSFKFLDKKRLQDSIDAWNKMSSGSGIHIEKAMQQVEDYLKSTDKK